MYKNVTVCYILLPCLFPALTSTNNFLAPLSPLCTFATPILVSCPGLCIKHSPTPASLQDTAHNFLLTVVCFALSVVWLAVTCYAIEPLLWLTYKGQMTLM